MKDVKTKRPDLSEEEWLYIADLVNNQLTIINVNTENIVIKESVKTISALIHDLNPTFK